MTDDAHEERFRQHEEMIEALARVFMRQGEVNEEQRAMNQRLERFIERQDSINADIRTTLAEIKTLITLLPRGGENGRDA
jgi:hypothetical protein